MVDRNLSVPGLFDAALDLPADQRAAFLDQACRGDHELREQVEALLGFLADARTGDLFPAIPGDTPRPLALGDRIGPYRVLRQLGAGGMGVVFLAEREDVEKRVAVKLIREGGLAAGDRLRRFLLERRVLARLEHPNIARLLDAGVTEYRLPFFAMEYVEGTPIDRYCDERRLSLAERMQLFRTVCHAVHHAHQNLIVHRDLKPSNILVTSDGQVKLLDFGIAKLLADQSSPGPAEANTGLLMLTPEYASPEQVTGGAVTTSSDVYSLGVVLYQLLTGHRPYRLSARTSAEAERVVCQVEPERPSLIVARAPALSLAELPVASTPEMIAQARGSTPERVQRLLRGDLDTIVLKALSKEPGRRYLSAAQLSDDLRRYLEGLPVLARPDTAGYRAGKFLRRHRLGVAAAALLFVTLVAGVVATAWQAQRAEAQRIVAEARFRDIHSLATTVLFDIHDAVAHLPGATRARALIVNRGLAYLQRLSSQSRGDRTLERESAEAYIRLGMAQGYPSGANLGDLAAARVSLGKALTLATALVASDPRDLLARRTLALAHEKLGDVKAWSGDVPGAVADAREALSHWAHLADMQPANPATRVSLAISTTKLGDLLGHPAFPNLGDRGGAESQYRRALALLEEPAGDSAVGWGRRRNIALAHERLGGMLRLDGRQDEALAALERSLALREELYQEDRTAMDAARDVAVSREVLCQVQLSRGDPSTAMRHCEAAVALYQDLRDADPGNAQSVTDLAIAESSLSQALAGRGSWSAALARLDRSTEQLREFLKTDPANLRAGRELARNLLRASMLHLRLSAGVPARPRAAHLEQARAFHASGREALARSIARGGTAEDEADERMAREVGERIALVQAAR